MDAHVTTDAKARKGIPLCTGLLDYFPDALLAVAELSRIGNDQHNPGQPLHWAREKSTDESDALLRHLVDRGKLDTDGVRHSAKVAWRALALLQRELEAARPPAPPPAPPAEPQDEPAWLPEAQRRYPGLRLTRETGFHDGAQSGWRDRHGDWWVARNNHFACISRGATAVQALTCLQAYFA